SSAWLREDGPIEAFSAVGYFICATLLLFWAGRGFWRVWCMPVAVIAMGLRELDFHVRFSQINVTKLRFYTSSTVPGVGTLIVRTTASFLGLAAGTLGRQHGRGL